MRTGGLHQRRDRRDRIRDAEQGLGWVSTSSTSHWAIRFSNRRPPTRSSRQWKRLYAPASSSSPRPATSACRRRRENLATQASCLQAMRRRRSRSDRPGHSTRTCAATIASRSTARVDRRGTTPGPSLISLLPGMVWSRPLRSRARSTRTIPTLRVGDGYLRLNGTSMATAVVSGTVALILQENRQASTPNAVKAILQYTALPVRDDQGAQYDVLTQGTGSVNAAGAIEMAAPHRYQEARLVMVADQHAGSLDGDRRPGGAVGGEHRLARRGQLRPRDV